MIKSPEKVFYLWIYVKPLLNVFGNLDSKRRIFCKILKIRTKNISPELISNAQHPVQCNVTSNIFVPPISFKYIRNRARACTSKDISIRVQNWEFG